VVEENAGKEPRRDPPTINDVARQAGVSKGLVSFVMNDRPGVAPATRARILQVADELGWRPNLNARTLSTRTTYALGLVLRREPHIVAADPFYPAFMAGVESVLAAEGRVLVLSVVPDAETEERTYRTFLADRRVDGVFLTDLRHGDARLSLLEELGLPAVLVGHLDEPVALPSVNLDDTQGVAAAVRHLADLGHQRIAHVAGDRRFLHARRRQAAFAAAMTAAGLDPAMVMDTDFTMRGGAAATRVLLGRAERPTAIVYANDPMAIAGLGVLQQRRIDVPGEVSIVGFDGTELARHVHPALTTIESDPEQWGAAAARTLLRLVADGRADDVELPAARLVRAASTAPPASPPTIPQS
jgi:DNA-binding LacI/PurR family transcriptional regulator